MRRPSIEFRGPIWKVDPVRVGLFATIVLATFGPLPPSGAPSSLAQGQSPKSEPMPMKLYSDEEIRKLAKYDIDKESTKQVLDVPCLDVVPSGEDRPRSEVFKTLKIEDNRIRDFRSEQFDFVVFLIWRVSPSYDISCMSAVNNRENDGLEMTDPRRKVYGIRLVKRSK